MLIVVPVAIKTHLHNVCAKNNYELLIVAGAGRKRSERWRRTRETFARWVLVCADGGTALNHCTKNKTKKKNRSEEQCVQTPGSTGAEASISSAQKHLGFQMKLMYLLLPPLAPFFPLCLALRLFIYADGEMEGIWELLR